MGQAKLKNIKIAKALEQFEVIANDSKTLGEEEKALNVLRGLFLNDFFETTIQPNSWVNTLYSISLNNDSEDVQKGFRELMNSLLENGSFEYDGRYKMYGLICEIETNDPAVIGEICDCDKLEELIASKAGVEKNTVKVIYNPTYGLTEMYQFSTVQPVIEVSQYFGQAREKVYGSIFPENDRNSEPYKKVLPFFVFFKDVEPTCDVYSIDFDKNEPFIGTFSESDESKVNVLIKPLKFTPPFDTLEHYDYYESYNILENSISDYCETEKLETKDVKINFFIFQDEDDVDGELTMTFQVSHKDSLADVEESEYLYGGTRVEKSIKYFDKKLNDLRVDSLIINAPNEA